VRASNRGSIGEEVWVLHHSDSVVSVFVVHVRHLVLRHMTAGTGSFPNGTGGSRMIGGGLRVQVRRMATEATVIIACELSYQGLVRVVAGHAGQARVSLTPTAATLQAIRMEADIGNSSGANSFGVPPCRVTSTAKVHQLHWLSVFGVENRSHACFYISGFHLRYVCGTRPMTTLAGDSRNGLFWVQATAGR
jgi:hypothetical protein